MPEDQKTPEGQKAPSARKVIKIRKAPQVQAAVIAKRMRGESERKISRDLNIDRQTVRRVLTASQTEEAVALGRSELYDLAPQMLNVVKLALKLGVEGAQLPEIKVALEAALFGLKGLGIAEERTRNRSEVKVTNEFENLSDEELRAKIDGVLQHKPKPN